MDPPTRPAPPGELECDDHVADVGSSVLVVYYSRTGTTATVAESIVEAIGDPVIERISPTKQRQYVDWLLRSAVPGSRTAIEPPRYQPAVFDAVFLGTPKWTFSCPPVTEYLHRVRLTGVTVGLFVTYGGFDERRYAESLERSLGSAGAHVAATLMVQSTEAEGLSTETVRRFVSEVVSGE